MDAARAAVSKITGRTGHQTDVDEVVNPIVTSETIKPHRHEETTEAVDREVHQHHYHTTVQPIQHKEQLPEKHTHNIVPQVQKEFRHDNEAETSRRVQAEIGQFQNTSTTHETRHTSAAAPQVVGEHVHHHVHETVQPVVHKETIQPEVVHTTIPIHETHHESAQHHGLSALPMKTLDEFTQAGGLLSGNKTHTHEEYEGAPRPYNDKLKTTIEKVLPGHHGASGTSGSGLTGTHDNTGMHGTGSGLTGTHGTGSGLTGSHNTSSGLTGSHNTAGGYSDTRGTGSGLTGSHDTAGGYSDTRGTSSGLTGSHNTAGGYSDTRGTGSGLTGSTGTGVGGSGLTGSHHNTGSGLTGGNTSSRSDYDNRPDSGVGVGQQHKPSLMDKLNPRVDATGDGKAGFMK